MGKGTESMRQRLPPMNSRAPSCAPVRRAFPAGSRRLVGAVVLAAALVLQGTPAFGLFQQPPAPPPGPTAAPPAGPDAAEALEVTVVEESGIVEVTAGEGRPWKLAKV